MTDARECVLQELLQKIAFEQKYENPDIETNAVPTTGANFTSQLFHATIRSEGNEDLNVFAKVAVIGETMREQAGTFDFFEKEPLFYEELGQTYKEIEDKHDVPDEHKLVLSKLYGYSRDYLKEVLVLQDLSKDGFVTWDRLKSIDWDYASRAVEEMAKFHALSLAHQKEYPEDYEKKAICFKWSMKEDDNAIDMFTKSLERVIQMTGEENRPRMRKFFFETSDPKDFMKFYQPKKRPVVVHGDYRQSNLMHKVNKDGKLQVVIVDFQTLLEGSVAMDLLYFIFTGSDGAFRARYYDQLIEHYYENLAAALRRLDLDPEEVFPRADFDEELKEMLPFALTISCMLIPLITIDLDDVTKNEDGVFENESMETMMGLMSNSNNLCAQRLNEAIDDFVKMGVL